MMRFTKDNVAIVKDGVHVPCLEENMTYHLIKFGDPEKGILPTINDVEPFEEKQYSDDEIIAEGESMISQIVGKAYTPDAWKSAAYLTKRYEAEYILALNDMADIDAKKCRILSAEATSKKIVLLDLARIVISRVTAYEQLVMAVGEAVETMKVLVENAENEQAKRAIVVSLVEKFKKAI